MFYFISKFADVLHGLISITHIKSLKKFDNFPRHMLIKICIFAQFWSEQKSKD